MFPPTIIYVVYTVQFGVEDVFLDENKAIALQTYLSDRGAVRTYDVKIREVRTVLDS